MNLVGCKTVKLISHRPDTSFLSLAMAFAINALHVMPMTIDPGNAFLYWCSLLLVHMT